MKQDVSQAIDNFFGQFRLRRYQKGQILLLSGDEAAYVYHLVNGRVKQYDVSYRGDEVIINVFKPPAFFPMSLVINKKPNLYIYEAETDVELHQAPAEEVLAFLRANPAVTFDLLSRVYSGVDGLLERLAHLMKSTAHDRLMFEILVHLKRFGQKNPDGSISLHLTESELGARSGLSRETVSREMRKLEKSGMVKLKAGTLTVPDPVALEQALAG